MTGTLVVLLWHVDFFKHIPLSGRSIVCRVYRTAEAATGVATRNVGYRSGSRADGQRGHATGEGITNPEISGGMDGEKLKRMAVAGGDEASRAFGELWSDWYRRLYTFARCWRGLPLSELDDAVSEALIAAYRALPGFDSGKPLGPWVYRIAANRFADLSRQYRRRLSLGPVSIDQEGVDGNLMFEPASPIDVAEASVGKELERIAGECIAAMADTDRRIAMLSLYEGMDSRQVGAVLRMNPATVRWRLSRIRARVRDRLEHGAGGTAWSRPRAENIDRQEARNG